MGYTVVHVDDIEGGGPGGAVRFVRRELGVEAFGINWFEIPRTPRATSTTRSARDRRRSRSSSAGAGTGGSTASRSRSGWVASSASIPVRPAAPSPARRA
jgi:hypothetical protein